MKKLFYLIPCLLIIDQLAKFLSINQSLTLIPGLLLIKYAINPGIIFGFFSKNAIFTVLLPIILIVFFLFLYFKEKIKRRLFSLGIILAITGLLGNLIDRFVYGYVIDFILVPINPERNISLFNLSDAFLIIGIILLVIYYYRNK